MAETDPRIDAYIAKAQDFAKPILTHIRALVHRACPEVEEKIKWGFPHFDYRGQMMCSMAGFKGHAVMGFWKAELMKDRKLLAMALSEVAMGHLGKLISLDDLPSDKKLLAYIKEAMKLNEDGVNLPPRKKVSAVEKQELVTPDDLSRALKKNEAAQETFARFSYTDRKEYIEWLEEAKTETTRAKRLAQTLEWLAEGKSRNWKHK